MSVADAMRQLTLQANERSIPLVEDSRDLVEDSPDLKVELEQGPRREPQSEDAISTEHVQEP